MNEAYKYNLRELVEVIPRSINVTKDLEQLGIKRHTYYRDKSILVDSKMDIPGARLLIYANYFSVTIDLLFADHFKRSKGKVVRIKTKLS